MTNAQKIDQHYTTFKAYPSTMTKLVVAFGLETVLGCHRDSSNWKNEDKSVFQSFLCHMTYYSQLETGQKQTDKQTDM